MKKNLRLFVILVLIGIFVQNPAVLARESSFDYQYKPHSLLGAMLHWIGGNKVVTAGLALTGFSIFSYFTYKWWIKPNNKDIDTNNINNSIIPISEDNTKNKNNNESEKIENISNKNNGEEKIIEEIKKKEESINGKIRKLIDLCYDKPEEAIFSECSCSHYNRKTNIDAYRKREEYENKAVILLLEYLRNYNVVNYVDFGCGALLPTLIILMKTATKIQRSGITFRVFCIDTVYGETHEYYDKIRKKMESSFNELPKTMKKYFSDINIECYKYDSVNSYNTIIDNNKDWYPNVIAACDLDSANAMMDYKNLLGKYIKGDTKGLLLEYSLTSQQHCIL